MHAPAAFARTPGRTGPPAAAGPRLCCRVMAWLRAYAQAVRSGLKVERARVEPLLAARGTLGLGLVLGFALWLSTPQVAISAALGAHISAVATFQRSWRPRPELALMATAGLAVSTFLGFLAAPYPVLYALVVAVWAFGSGLAWAVGPTSGIVASTTVVVMLVIVAVPVSVVEALVHAGVIAAGGVVQAGLAVALPVRRWGAQRDALADAYAAVADYGRRLRHDPLAAFDPGPLMVARSASAVTRRQARHRPAELHGRRAVAERIRPLLAAIADPAVGAAGQGPERDRARELLGAAASVLDAVAHSIRTGEPVRVPGAASATLALPEPGWDLSGPARRASVRLVGLLGEAVESAGGPGGEDGARYLARPSVAGLVPVAWQEVRGELDRSSPVLRHAVRVAVVAAAGHVAGDALPWGHGAWAPMAAVVVMRPDFAQTMSRGVARLAGTLGGVLVATAVVAFADPGRYAGGGLAVASAGLMYLLLRAGFAVASACVTGYVVFLLAMAGGPWQITAAARIVETVLGGCLALAAYVVLPAWERSRLADRLADYLEASCGYAAAVLAAYGDPAGRPPRAVRDALLGQRRARLAWEAAVVRANAEPVRHEVWSPRVVEDADEALTALGRVALVLEGHLPGPDAPPVAGAAEFAGRLREAARRGADEVRGERPPRWDGLARAHGSWAGSAGPDELPVRGAGELLASLEELGEAVPAPVDG
jgi:uncharacterized membrane protein YccC